MDSESSIFLDALIAWLGGPPCNVHPSWLHMPLDPFTLDVLMNTPYTWEWVIGFLCHR